VNLFLNLRSVLFRTGRAQEVSVTLAGGLFIPSVRAARYDKSIEPGFDPTEDGTAFRRVRFEIPFDQLPLGSKPARKDSISDGSADWTVVEVETKPETASWMISVEEADA
jgi:hypothetical protein